MSRYAPIQDSSTTLSSIVIIGILYYFYTNLSVINAWITGHTAWIKTLFFIGLAISFIYPYQGSNVGDKEMGYGQVGQQDSVPQLMRSMILSDQHGRCARCQQPLRSGNYRIDFITPIYRGGMQQSTNYHAVCGQCYRNSKIEEIIRLKSDRI